VATIVELSALARAEHGLTVVSTLRPDLSIQSSLVNAGVMPHPLNGDEVLGFVTYGRVKLSNLRARPELTALVRSGWNWAALEGTAQLIGPDDAHPEVDSERLRLLLREIFVAAGGQHDDWDEFDRVMREQRRTAVLVKPARVYGN
jgi:PPOX class probable F420-dependent enzyme